MTPKDITEKMEEYLPLLKKFTDKDMAGKVANVWYQLWQESKWENLEEAIWNPLCPGVTLLKHTTMVTTAALEFAKIRNEIYEESLNLDTLLAGGLLHDASKLLEVEPDGKNGAESKKGKLFQHSFLGAHKALMEGFPDEVVHIIISHTGKSRVVPQTPEAVIMYAVDIADADINRINVNEKLLISNHK